MSLALAGALVAAVGALGPEPENRPPDLTVPAEVRVLVDEQLRLELDATDPEGAEVTWSATGLPDGAALDPGGVLRWVPGPADVGTHHVQMAASDPEGASRRTGVRLLVRHEPRPGLLVALGDSVASGHGLDWRHWLGRDPCWRDERAAYPALVLADRGDLTDLALVACSGHRAAHLHSRDLAGVGPLAGDDRPRSQVEWAVTANPGVVTVTVGANDLDFARPAEAVTAEGELDDAHLAARLDRVEVELARNLRRLVEATDSRIVVTNYHDPTAPRPHGVPGCRDECFAAAAAEAVGRLNGRIADVAGRFPPDRVVLADVADAFAGRGAPNGRGPDVLRGLDAPSWVPGVLTWASGVHPYCARGRAADHQTLVSAADCVHPNRAGARAYADAVLDALEALEALEAPG